MNNHGRQWRRDRRVIIHHGLDDTNAVRIIQSFFVFGSIRVCPAFLAQLQSSTSCRPFNSRLECLIIINLSFIVYTGHGEEKETDTRTSNFYLQQMACCRCRLPYRSKHNLFVIDIYIVSSFPKGLLRRRIPTFTHGILASLRI